MGRMDRNDGCIRDEDKSEGDDALKVQLTAEIVP